MLLTARGLTYPRGAAAAGYSRWAQGCRVVWWWGSAGSGGSGGWSWEVTGVPSLQLNLMVHIWWAAKGTVVMPGHSPEGLHLRFQVINTRHRP